MKKIKILLALLSVLVGLVALLIIGAFIYIDSIAKQGIERGATYALAVPTTLDSADIKILGGEFGLSGLQISNPEGYDTPYFMSLGSGTAELDLGSLQNDTVEIPSLVLEDIDIYLDKEGGKANYTAILDNLKRFEQDKADTPDSASKDKKKYVIRTVEVRNVTAHVEFLPIAGNLTRTTVKVPEIILTDVGEKDPVTIAKLTNVLIKAIFASVINVGSGVLPQGITDGLNAGMGQLAGLASMGIGLGVDVGSGVVNIVGDVGGLALDAAGAVTSEIGDGAESVVKGVGGLLGLGDDDDDKDAEDEDKKDNDDGG